MQDGAVMVDPGASGSTMAVRPANFRHGARAGACWARIRANGGSERRQVRPCASKFWIACQAPSRNGCLPAREPAAHHAAGRLDAATLCPRAHTMAQRDKRVEVGPRR